LTTQDKALVRLQLIYEQTNKTAGDFVNTSDSLANKQRILAARFEDTKAKVGESLAPAFDTLLDLGDALLPMLEDLAPAFGQVGQAIAALAQLAAPAIGVLGKTLSITSQVVLEYAGFLGSDLANATNAMREAQDNMNASLLLGQGGAEAYRDSLGHLLRNATVTGSAISGLGEDVRFTQQQQAVAIREVLRDAQQQQATINSLATSPRRDREANRLRGLADETQASVMNLTQAYIDQVAALDLSIGAKQALLDAEGISAIVTADNIQLVSELTAGYEDYAVRQHDAATAAEAASEAKSKAYIDEANEVDALREAERNEALAAAKRVRDFPGQVKAIDKAARAFDGLASNIRGATSAALEAASPALALNAANERVAAAEEALKTVREDGKSSAEDMASAVADLTGAQLELDAQRANVLGTMGDTETAMRNAATEVGITKEEFDTFWQSLDDRPSSVDFDINFRFHTSGGGLGAPPSISSGVTESRFQHGGDFTAGQPIRVGEAGPELIIPTGSGTVIPNNQLSQNVTVHMEGTGDVYDDMSLALAMSGITEEIEWSGTSTLRG
jgi:hypothetical protein